MKEKSDKSKMRDGRGIFSGGSYEAWKTARESKSIGTSSAVYDPIQRRTVNLLSQAEKKVFWVLRYNLRGRILEQYPMYDTALISSICQDLGVRAPSRILSIDFLVEKNDGRAAAISVKANDRVFDEIKHLRRYKIEKNYWETLGVPHHVVYADSISVNLAGNIKDVMYCWDEGMITDKTTLLMHLISRHAVKIPLNKGRIAFKAFAESLPVEEIYEAYQNRRNTGVEGPVLDLSERCALPHLEPRQE